MNVVVALYGMDDTSRKLKGHENHSNVVATPLIDGEVGQLLANAIQLRNTYHYKMNKKMKINENNGKNE